MNKFIVVAYYTDDEIYSRHSINLVKSLQTFNLEYEIECIKSLGTWQKNTHYKPEFTLKMLKKYPTKSIYKYDWYTLVWW